MTLDPAGHLKGDVQEIRLGDSAIIKRYEAQCDKESRQNQTHDPYWHSSLILHQQRQA